MRNIPWKTKSSLFRLIDFFNAEKTLYLAQKYLTKRSKRNFTHYRRRWIQHREVINKANTLPVIFEFGAGKDLSQNLFLSSSAMKQYLIDLNFMLDLELCEAARLELVNECLLEDKGPIFSIEDLLKYGIDYRAPADASDTPFPDASIDMCISTATLEHIPEESICMILKELYRIIKAGGLVSAVIDYSDHYSHSDSSISQLNFLRFSESEWKRYNHRYHYQNRLRHERYIELFQHYGFKLIKAELDLPDEEIPYEINNLFVDHDPTWSAVASHCVFAKV